VGGRKDDVLRGIEDMTAGIRSVLAAKA